MKRIEYDPEVKILEIYFKGGKSIDSDVKGNVVLDYDKKGNLVKLEVMDVNLEDFLQTKLVKGKLSHA